MWSTIFFIFKIDRDIWEIKEDIQVVSEFPSLLGHPVQVQPIFALNNCIDDSVD